MSRLLRLGGLLSRKRSRRSELAFGSLSLRNVRPVKAPRGASALNKSARLVLRAEADIGAVKVWEAANRGHADFLARLFRDPRLAKYFPPVVEVVGAFIAARWVEGAAVADASGSVAPETLERMAALLADIHDFPGATAADAHFDYWADLIRPRFERAAMLVGREETALATCATVERYISASEPCLSHPDLSPANLIRTAGGLVSIDNELVAPGRAPFMDVLNACRGLAAAQRQDFRNAYLRTSAREWPPPEVVQSFWLARESGALFVKAATDRLADLFGRYGRGEDVLPPER